MDVGTFDVTATWPRPRATDVAAARGVAAAAMTALGIGETGREQAAVMVSELATNAIRHGGPPLQLRVWARGQRWLVTEVRDGALRLPLLPAAQELAEVDPLSVSGRGLALVTAYADSRCGVVPLLHAAGKSVWFALPLAEQWLDATRVAAHVQQRVGSEL